MSFDDYERSRSIGRPDTLYKFTFDVNVYAYTDAEEAITTGGVTYEPIPIDRDAVSSAGNLDKSAVGIRVPYDTPIAELFRVFPPSEVVGVTMFQGHEGEEYLAVYSGRVVSCGWEDSTATLRCEPVNTAMRRPGLRMRYQYGCPHALYSPSCGADVEIFSFEHAVVAIGPGYVTLGDGWEGAYDAGKYKQGMISWEADGRREIRSVGSASAVTNRIQVQGSLNGLTVGTVVTLTLGCNHQLSDCEGVFDNAPNFGGCPWIPLKNPIKFVNQFW